MKALPVFAPIPFTLTVITHSKTMKRGDKSSDGPIFPNPPQRPEEINFRLESDVWLRAQSWDTTRQGIFITRLGGLGSGEKTTAFGLIHVDVLEKIWIPEGEKTENGKWKQEVTFKSSFQLNCAPGFSSETMTLSASLSSSRSQKIISDSRTS